MEITFQNELEQYSVCAMDGCVQTYMAALFPNHRINEDMPKSMKVNSEQTLILQIAELKFRLNVSSGDK